MDLEFLYHDIPNLNVIYSSIFSFPRLLLSLANFNCGRRKTDGSSCQGRQNMDMQCQVHAVTGDHTSVETCNTSYNPSRASLERRQQLWVLVFGCKQMFMGDWLIISQVISFTACVKLEWRSLIREIEHIHLLSRKLFLEFRYICLSFQRYDYMIYLRFRKHFRNKVYLKNNSISPFVLNSSTPVCIWPFSIAIISYDSVPYAWKE